ncbi:MAG: hypothetical protein LBU89_01365 [Fibromonadaceae bacterium]|jgi:hypothetical protein|nr:hypothetical protein [Fibromonadaceae bacterium]
MKRVYFCIDGFSFKRINDFYRYEHKRRSRLNVAAIETYLRYEIQRRFEWKSDSGSLEVEKHFYHPSDNPLRGSFRRDVREAILGFEKNLVKFGYIVHYARQGSILNPRPNESLFSDWMIAYELQKYDVFVLLSTQGQHAGILRQAKLCNVPSMLIGWESICKNSSGEQSRWKTDKTLVGYANAYCPLEKMLNHNNKHPFANFMFERFNFSSQPLSLHVQYQQASSYGIKL